MVSAISLSACRSMEPTLSRRGSAAPFSTEAALRSRSDAGGVLVTKENGPVFEHRDMHRDYGAALIGRPRVIFLDETHYVNPMLTQRGANRRGQASPYRLPIEA